MSDQDATTLGRSQLQAARAGAADRKSLYVRRVYAEGCASDASDLDRVFPLEAGRCPSIVVGRRPAVSSGERALTLDFDVSASRTHARFRLLTVDGDDRIVVEDLGSRNGTIVGGERIDGRAVADAGQVIRVGGCVFVVGQAPLRRAERVRAERPPPRGFDARSWCALELWDRLVALANSDAGVLLLGEMGTGKTRLARLVHERSPRRREPFGAYNCSAIPRHLEEATLFGVEGGFIPTVEARKGWITAVGRGTLFLDELGDMPLLAQAKLLDAFDPTEPSYVPVGGTRRLKTECRLISATNRDIFGLARAGAIRQDLLSRLVVAQVTVPPLRERREDLLAIYGAALRRAGGDLSKGAVPTAELAEAMLLARWVENARGVESLAKRTALGEPMTVESIREHADRGHGPAASTIAPPVAPSRPRPTPEQVVWPPNPEELLDLLARHAWNLRAAAQSVGRRRETVSRLVTAVFGGKVGLQRAWRVWQLSGRIPTKDQIEPLYDLFCEQPDEPETLAARQAWRMRGVTPTRSGPVGPC